MGYKNFGHFNWGGLSAGARSGVPLYRSVCFALRCEPVDDRLRCSGEMWAQPNALRIDFQHGRLSVRQTADGKVDYSLNDLIALHVFFIR